jgi:altronate hydrolase
MDTALKIHPDDTVAVALQEIPPGVEVFGVTAAHTIPVGHKMALEPIAAGTPVIKYGNVIGIASRDIQPGEHVHTNNLTTALNEDLEYKWIAPSAPQPDKASAASFMGYERPDGRIGIRNEVWVINTVGCVNMTAQRLVQQASTLHAHESIDGFFTFNHPFGCSQLGDDLNYTQRLLAGLINHPNAAAVLVLGLGCENNQMRDQLSEAGDIDPDRIHFFNAQEVEDEIEFGLEKLGALAEYARSFERRELSADKLILAGKCGGSDAEPA